MISDKELTRQIVERDILNLYKNLPILANQIGINIAPILTLFEDKIFKYIDMGLDTLFDSLFGSGNNSGDIDEASEIAKMAINDKIEEYRRRVRENKQQDNI